jgi:hypothetical protein
MPSRAKHYFGKLEPRIQEIFAGIISEIGAPQGIKLAILEAEEFHGTRLNRARTIFEAAVPGGPVRITWDALASLWFCSFGAIRAGERLFRERRSDVRRMQIDEPLHHGLAGFKIAQGLIRQPLGAWSDKLPLPAAEPAPGTEDQNVMSVFFGSLGWILRHELAHVILDHQETQTPERMKEDEFSADAQASRWLKGDRQRDRSRALGARPSASEIDLEGRAVRMGIGLLWVARFEEHSGRASTDHPEVAVRFHRCLEIFDLPVDSGAAEILSDILKSWLDPDGAWIVSTDPKIATAQAALDEALYRLQRHIQR